MILLGMGRAGMGKEVVWDGLDGLGVVCGVGGTMEHCSHASRRSGGRKEGGGADRSESAAAPVRPPRSRERTARAGRLAGLRLRQSLRPDPRRLLPRRLRLRLAPHRLRLRPDPRPDLVIQRRFQHHRGRGTPDPLVARGLLWAQVSRAAADRLTLLFPPWIHRSCRLHKAARILRMAQAP